MGDDIKQELVTDMKTTPFSLMVDGSNDAGLEKMFPISIRIFDVNFNRVMTKFFDMNMLEGRSSSTAEFMFDSIDQQLAKNGLSWDMVSGIGLDNTNANIGEHNSIKSRVLQKNSEIVISGCPCHILHNASSKAAEAFGNIVDFSVEDHCVDLFYWFDKSSKRKSILKEYYDFCDQDYEEVIKYISTRWLCTERCINRELKKFSGLRSYFLSESENDRRFKRLTETFSNNMTEFYLFFFQAALPTFTNFNKFLQTEEPLIQCLYDEMQMFMNKLAAKFIKPEVIRELKGNELSFSKLDVSLANQKNDKDLTIGNVTKPKLRRVLDEGDISQYDVDKFYDAVREFYETAYSYCVKWLPLDEPLYKGSRFIEFSNRSKFSFEDLTGLLQSFPKRFEKYLNDPQCLDALEEEYLLYEAMVDSEIPENVWEESLVKVTESRTYHRMDMVWSHLKTSLPKLSEIALFLLTIPHSNAGEERIFSMVGKNKTKFRSNLDNDKSLNSIMLIKMNKPESFKPCYQWKFSQDLLKKCKMACKNYNKQHSSAANS